MASGIFDPHYLRDMGYRRWKLQIHRIVAGLKIPEQNVELEVSRDVAERYQLLHLVRKVAVLPADEELVMHVLPNWREHLKAELHTRGWFPEWAKLRWPVRWEREVYRAEAMFPERPIDGNASYLEVVTYNWAE